MTETVALHPDLTELSSKSKRSKLFCRALQHRLRHTLYRHLAATASSSLDKALSEVIVAGVLSHRWAQDFWPITSTTLPACFAAWPVICAPSAIMTTRSHQMNNVLSECLPEINIQTPTPWTAAFFCVRMSWYQRNEANTMCPASGRADRADFWVADFFGAASSLRRRSTSVVLQQSNLGYAGQRDHCSPESLVACTQQQCTALLGQNTCQDPQTDPNHKQLQDVAKLAYVESSF